MRITRIAFKYGQPGGAPLEFVPQNICLIVGPNNSGKSETLRDIESWCLSPDAKMKLLSNIEIEIPTDPETIDRIMNEYKGRPTQEETLTAEETIISIPNFRDNQVSRHRVQKSDFRDHFRNKNSSFLRRFLLRGYSIRLDGRTRFNLIDDRNTGDLKEAPTNYLASLFRKDSDRQRLQKIVYDEFGINFYLDPTVGGQLKIVTSDQKISNERALDEIAIEQYARAIPLRTLGDGLQAFVGLLIAVMSLRHDIMLVDEPEAFLHPPTAQSLARHLSTFAKERQGSLIVATHSPEFLIGCLEKSQEITVVRLTYEKGVGTAKLLQPQDVKTMATDPLLRSTDTLNALFHKAAIITEGDADRVFYSEINRKLLAIDKGIRDAVFLNAQNKHTIHRMMGPLRKIGVPAACIFDLDVLRYEQLKNESTTLWIKIMTIANVPTTEISRLDGERAFVESELNKKNITGQPERIKAGGIDLLDSAVKTRGNAFVEEMSKYGIFIVPIGELEQWASQFGQDNSKIWIVDMLERLNSPGLVPTDDGVWKFLDGILRWTSDPNRQGM